MSHFDDSGFYVRAPDSGVEAIDFPALKAAGFKSLALNYKDFPKTKDWAVITERASRAGLWILPWGRCETEQQVVELTDKARQLPSRTVIVNCESELYTQPGVTLECVADATSGLDACLSTLPWVGTPALNLELVDELEVHLQLFPQEQPHTSEESRDCRAHAFDAGAKRVDFMLGVHDLDDDPFPPRPRGTWVYTLDDCQQDWQRWKPQYGAMLTLPFTGPLYGPSSATGKPRKTKTAKALKTTLHEAGMANFPRPDQSYNAALERALRRLQLRAGITPLSGAYGRRTYDAVRTLMSAEPGGTFACTPAAEALIRADAAA